MTEELINYIKENVAKGVPINVIKQQLLATGWKQQQIDQAFEIIETITPTAIGSFNGSKPKKLLSAKVILVTSLLGLLLGLVIPFLIVLKLGFELNSTFISNYFLNTVLIGTLPSIYFIYLWWKYEVKGLKIIYRIVTIALILLIISLPLSVPVGIFFYSIAVPGGPSLWIATLMVSIYSGISVRYFIKRNIVYLETGTVKKTVVPVVLTIGEILLIFGVFGFLIYIRTIGSY